ncbi:MAG: hypothetical protein RL038_643 [Actinomycetota bacterium]
MALEPRVWPDSAQLDEAGELIIAGVSARDLVREFGTPLFVVDEAHVRTRAHEFKTEFDDEHMPFTVHYASKAFSAIEILKWVHAEGLGVDVATGGELAMAQAAGVPGKHIVMHGNNKSMHELQRAVQADVRYIVVDSFDEIDRLAQLARGASKPIDVLLRLTLGVEAHTHEFIATAHEDQKFGLSIASGAAERAVIALTETPNVRLCGFHYHIGSQVFDTAGFSIAVSRALGFIAHLRNEHGFVTLELDIGGGLGVAYVPTDDPMPIADFAHELRNVIRAECADLGIPVPKLSLEPGRAVVGGSTVTLYEVGTIKPVELDGGQERVYVSVDGGMSDAIRTALYGAEYTVRLANRAPMDVMVQSRVVGKHCETGDLVVRDCQLPADIRPGDLLAVATTGAYHYSMASNYNLVPRPAVVAVKNGRARLIVRRESEADLLRLQVSDS